MGSRTKTVEMASTEQLENELKRVNFNNKYMKILRSTVYALIITAAVSVLVVSLILPVLQIYGSSMSPSMEEGDIILAVKQTTYKYGDIIGLYYANRVLVKRVIAKENDVVELDENGNFTVNGQLLDEPYITEKFFGDTTDIEFPYEVPPGTYFVVGDNRKESVDSRCKTVGCISKDDIVGKLFFTIWPLPHFGFVN